MPASKMAGKVQTVLGPIEPEALGVTLTHEHLLIDFRPLFVEPLEASQKALAYQPIALENLGWIRYNWDCNLDNLSLFDEQTAIDEALLYRRAGGVSLVDATNIGLGRDPLALTHIARATGLNVIMGSGYYVEPFRPPAMDEKTEEEILEGIVQDISVGVGNTGVRAGIIGEIGCSWPLTENERKSLRAAARAQQQTGASLLIHPGRNSTAPQEITGIIGEVGGNLRRTIMSHIDRTIFDFDTLRKLADTGCYIEYDLFGLESTIYPLAPIDMPNDGKRIDFIIRLIDEGYLDQVVLAHDIAFKFRLVKYGGHGYAHILQNVVPIMRRKGIKEEQIDAMLVENPKRVLAFV